VCAAAAGDDLAAGELSSSSASSADLLPGAPPGLDGGTHTRNARYALSVSQTQTQCLLLQSNKLSDAVQNQAWRCKTSMQHSVDTTFQLLLRCVAAASSARQDLQLHALHFFWSGSRWPLYADLPALHCWLRCRHTHKHLHLFCCGNACVQLGFHAKPIGLLNTEGFYDPLLAFFKHCVDEVRPPWLADVQCSLWQACTHACMHTSWCVGTVNLTVLS
jgi:hypothetical protein